MITLTGQLAIKTIHGRNGDFNVARLLTSLGEFSVRNPILEQYKEGMYDGDFVVTQIRQAAPYFVGSRMILDPPRAELESMTLSGIDALSSEDATRLTPQEPDPIEEDRRSAALAAVETPMPEPTAPALPDPLTDTTPFPFGTASKSTADSTARQAEDVSLFGTLWPLAQVVKLDPTVGRLVLRKQMARLDRLGYGFEPTSQDWHLKDAA